MPAGASNYNILSTDSLMTNAMSDASMTFELWLRTPNKTKYSACYVLPFKGTVDTN